MKAKPFPHTLALKDLIPRASRHQFLLDVTMKADWKDIHVDSRAPRGVKKDISSSL